MTGPMRMESRDDDRASMNFASRLVTRLRSHKRRSRGPRRGRLRQQEEFPHDLFPGIVWLTRTGQTGRRRKQSETGRIDRRLTRRAFKHDSDEREIWRSTIATSIGPDKSDDRKAASSSSYQTFWQLSTRRLSHIHVTILTREVGLPRCVVTVVHSEIGWTGLCTFSWLAGTIKLVHSPHPVAGLSNPIW